MTDFLNQKLSSLPASPHGEVKCLLSTESVGDAMVFLHRHGVLSAPVLDASVAAGQPMTERCVGIVDGIDLVTSMLNAMDTASVSVDVSVGDAEEGAISLSTVHLTGFPDGFTALPLSRLSELQCQLQPFDPLTADASLADALARVTKGVRRVPVVSADGKHIVNILSQSALLKVVLEMETPGAATWSLKEVGLADCKPVLSVYEDEPIGRAFLQIAGSGVGGVPVLARDDTLLGNVSARDAYTIMTAVNKGRLLAMPARLFLQRAAKAVRDTRYPGIRCHSEDSLRDVLSRMLAASIHHIYLCDDEGKVLRVISLGDVLEKFTAAIASLEAVLSDSTMAS